MEIKQIQLIEQTNQITLKEALTKWREYWLNLCNEIEAERLNQNLVCNSNKN
jgi:hypothetical protein